ncbi:bifunctional diguanylate cyclase/phosphodiesterase [Geminicoccaceae bacterium 1502E]|nr:bifunctional diguanylate cyclase/phosphodiesterase [Geminicoccaceae bacterium 1502E]
MHFDNVEVEAASTPDERARRGLAARARHLAVAGRDPLTGLLSRVTLLKKLERLVRREEQLALLCVDLRDFRVLNESLGHATADALLVAVAQRLRRIFPEAPALARIGGDAFAVACPGIYSDAEAREQAERLVSELSRPYSVAGRVVRVGWWIGAALCPAHGDRSEALLRGAEAALQRARAERCDAPALFAPAMRVELRQRAALDCDLRRSLDEDHFHLAYQPIHALGDGAFVGVECLLRWRHPERGEVPAGDFIPLAEETGLIVPLGARVLGRACRQAAQWQTAGLPPFRIAVNLSASQFAQSDLVQTVEEALAESGLPARMLELEITERVLVADVEGALEVIRRLRALGVRMALDDFGTGYSSLAYLQRFPFDRLKIDRSFVAGLGGEGPGPSIVRTIVQLAHSLQMDVVGEGIETPAQLHQLRRAGCDFGQGWLFARPCPAARIAQLARLRKPLAEAV